MVSIAQDLVGWLDSAVLAPLRGSASADKVHINVDMSPEQLKTRPNEASYAPYVAGTSAPKLQQSAFPATKLHSASTRPSSPTKLSEKQSSSRLKRAPGTGSSTMRRVPGSQALIASPTQMRIRTPMNWHHLPKPSMTQQPRTTNQPEFAMIPAKDDQSTSDVTKRVSGRDSTSGEPTPRFPNFPYAYAQSTRNLTSTSAGAKRSKSVSWWDAGMAEPYPVGREA